MPELASPTVALVRLAVEHVAAAPEEEQRYLELNFALDRAVERNLRYRELLALFEEGSLAAASEACWAWRLAAGLTSNLMGDTGAAFRCLDQAKADLEASSRGNTAAASFVYSELARAHFHTGDSASALATANHALQLARAANSFLAQAYAHHYLGLISIRRRDYDYAGRHLTAARDLFDEMHQRHGRARVLDSLAVLEMEQGRLDQVRELLEESLAVKEELRDLRGQALTCGNLARLYAALGDYPQAMHYLDRERLMISRVGDERTETEVCIQLGELHLRHGAATAAREELLRARAMAQSRRDERLEAYACFALSEAERQSGFPERAREAITRAADYFDAADDPVMRDRAAVRRALLHDESPYAPAVQEPLDRLRQTHVSEALAETLFEVANFFQEHHCTHQATALYAEALDTADVAHADQLGNLMRSRAESAEARAWVDAILTVKQQKDSLEKAYAELRRAESLRDALTQMIVHDLKNPLAAIVPWLQTIQMGILSQEETEEHLQSAIDECDYLLRIIEDLNDVGKMQLAEKPDLALERLDLREMVHDVARRLQGRARECRVEIRVEDPGELPPVMADRRLLQRVLENLVANAIKYGRPIPESGCPPEICLCAVAEPPFAEGGRPYVRVEIRDFGPGIPAAEADRVFEPYYQAEAGRKRKAGVGLGLAFCRMVVEAHAGTIWTQPNQPCGSIFAFRLPVAEPAA